MCAFLEGENFAENVLHCSGPKYLDIRQMEFDFKHADNIWLFLRKQIVLHKIKKDPTPRLFCRGFQIDVIFILWWQSLITKVQLFAKKVRSHNTVKELQSDRAEMHQPIYI